MNRKIREAVRYLGYGRHAIDEQTLALVESSMEELSSGVRERFIYRIFELSQEGETLKIGDWEIKSRSLSKNMKGCRQAAVFAATLGPEADQMIRRASVTEMAKAVVLQACAAALLEEYCDSCQDRIAQEMAEEGKYLRPRFSPGYGDFDICHQEMLFEDSAGGQRPSGLYDDKKVFMLTPHQNRLEPRPTLEFRGIKVQRDDRKRTAHRPLHHGPRGARGWTGSFVKCESRLRIQKRQQVRRSDQI